VVICIGCHADCCNAKCTEREVSLVAKINAQAQLFDEIFHHGPAIKLLISPDDGSVRDANPAAVTFYGYSREQLQGFRISDLNTLPMSCIQEEMRAAQREERNCFRFEHRLADGRLRDVEVFSSPITLGDETFLLSIIHDVTARNDTERELSVLQDVVENLPVGIYRSSMEGKGSFISLNREMINIAGADSAEQLLNTPVSALYADMEERKEFINKLMEAGDWHSQTLRLKTLKGQLGHYRVTVRKRRDDEGAIFIDGILEDINHLRAAEQSRQQLFEIIEATPAIIGISEPSGELVYLNTAGREMMGLSPEDSLASFEPRRVHTESSFRTLVDEALPTAIEKGHWTGEMSFRTAEGESLPVQTTLISHFDEQGELLRISAVSIDVSSQKQRQRVLEEMAYQDSLTKLLNRRGFLRLLKSAVDQARSEQSPLAVLMADLDHFKPINDQHGHPVGDEILKKITPFLKGKRRRDDYVGRLGGEEFGITLPGAKREDALTVAEDIRKSLAAEPIQTSAGPITVTISIGIATFDDRRESGKSLIRRADEALYMAKEAGRNRVAVL